jgi:uncharacterized linocin/CFP29 family protein
MHSDLVELGWTEDHWNRISAAVTEEAQKARVAAQMLPLMGPEDPTTVAIPPFTLNPLANNPLKFSANTPAARLEVSSDPTLHLTRLSVNVPLHFREAADPDLTAALVMFRRAANYIARTEDALLFNGRPGPGLQPAFGTAGIPGVVSVSGDGAVAGIFPFVGGPGARPPINVRMAGGGALGDQVVTSIVQAINQLDSSGQLGPYSCVLSPRLFEAICTPNANLVLPRDRILPFLQGPLLRSAAVFEGPVGLARPFIAWGAVLAMSANPVELVVASDLHVRFLQASEEPRLLFRVAEKVALRIKEPDAIALLRW